MKRTLFALAATVALSGCLSLGGKAPPTLFTLGASQAVPAGTTATGKASEAVIVVEPEADRRLGVQRVAVQVDASNVAYLKDALWVERPTRLFRGLLAETLRARGGRLVFEEDQPLARGAQRLSGRLVDMGYDARAMAAVVRFDAVRELPGGTLTTKRFEAVVNGVSAKPEAVGPALNRAANQVAAQVAEWVG